MPADPLARRFAYNTWANRETLRSLRDAAGAGPLPDRAPGARRTHRRRRAPLARPARPARGRRRPGGLAVVLPGRVGAHLDALARAWPAILDRFLIPPDGLDRTATYTNSQGLTFTSRAGDIFEHLFLHAHYHRGQVAALLGRAGRTPAYTDFIHWVRTGEPA